MDSILKKAVSHISIEPDLTFGLENFLLNIQSLSENKETAKNEDVDTTFLKDLTSGKLEKYRGTFVAYHHLTLCGQSKDFVLLSARAENYYTGADLRIYRVPQTSTENIPAKVLRLYAPHPNWH